MTDNKIPRPELLGNWPPIDIASEIRLLKTRLSVLETEVKERYQALDERMNSIERELDELVND